MGEKKLGWRSGKESGGPYSFPPREDTADDKSRDAPAIDRPQPAKTPGEGVDVPVT